jgi:hypothetical protein
VKTFSKLLIAGTLSLLSAAPAFAHQGQERPLGKHQRQERPFVHDKLFARMERQQERIDKGVMKRQLTHKEAKMLRRQQREIHRLAWRFYRDGNLSQKERQRLARELDRSSRQIKQLKHNELGRYVDLHQRYGYREKAHKL